MGVAPLTQTRILACPTHDGLFDLLSEELQRRLPEFTGGDLDQHLRRLRMLPVGLHAMAVVHPLDVSITLDDLGWHFGNWPHHDYSKETIWALRELEAFEQAELFEQAYALAQPHWSMISTLPDDKFSGWYYGSAFARATEPLTRRFWQLQEIDNGLLGYWTRYARKYPHKVAMLSVVRNDG
jgi:hypothetical protein